MRRYLPILIILLIAAALRLIALDQVPPGLQHDEVIHGHDAITVLLGYHPLYFTSNAGNEPLFIYLMSATINLLGTNLFGIRIAAVMCGLLTILFSYLWIRRAFNHRTALIAASFIAVNFWPLFLSRVGLRAASLPMMVALTAYLFSPILSQKDDGKSLGRSSIMAGIALGLTLYTYPASRVFPIVFFLFWLLHSVFSRRLHKSALFILIAALITMAPLAYTIATLPQGDQRLQQLGGPVEDALHGYLQPVLTYTIQTLGMFTFAGDPITRYNIPGRPVFDPITGLLFYFGLLLTIKHRRDPRNLFALIWLPIGLLPSMLSDSAPSFLRASVSLPVTFLFPSIAMDWGIQEAFVRTGKGWHRKYQSTFAVLYKLLPIAAILVIGLNCVLTIHAYFVVWPNQSDVREVYRSDLAQAARWIEQQPTRTAPLSGASADQPIVIASTNPRDLDPFLYDFELNGQHDLRWIDRAYALAFPAQQSILISPAYAPIDPILRSRFLPEPSFVSKFGDGSTAFEVYDLDWASTRLAPTNIITTARTDSLTLTVPINIGHSLQFLGYETQSIAQPGDMLKLTLYWRVSKDVGAQQLPLSLFVHVLNASGDFAAGRDLLAYPTAGWRDDDVWLQQNVLQLPSPLDAGTYRVEIGAYSQADNVRWRIYDAAGNDVGARLLLSEVVIR
ncbi:MAG TPA: glycosyltransferase family 39 protein [Anaerolineae bacterium]|nr:glycosyltransferase family 39 protein [Anaerolineae bacterium]